MTFKNCYTCQILLKKLTFSKNLDPSNTDIANFSPLRAFFTYASARNCAPTNTQVANGLIQILQSAMVGVIMDEIKVEANNCFLNAFTSTSTVYTNYA